MPETSSPRARAEAPSNPPTHPRGVRPAAIAVTALVLLGLFPAATVVVGLHLAALAEPLTGGVLLVWVAAVVAVAVAPAVARRGATALAARLGSGP